MFMIADMDKWMQQDEQLISCLVGEVMLTLTQEADFAFAKLDVLMIGTCARVQGYMCRSTCVRVNMRVMVVEEQLLRTAVDDKE